MELILIFVVLYVTFGVSYALFQIKSAIRFGEICPDELLKEDPQILNELEIQGINIPFLASVIFFVQNMFRWPSLVRDHGFSPLIEEKECQTLLAQRGLKR